jgi:hypothetical protein
MDRDQVRAALKATGITCQNVTDKELKLLRRVISKHLRKSGIFKGTARIARAHKDLKFIEMKAFYFDRREAVSFNTDGFIGVAGWADNKNVQPLLAALMEWSGMVHQ